MSDLQASLLVIGVLVVGGVTAFNWYQERRLRRRLEEGGESVDGMLRVDPLASPAARVEPQLGVRDAHTQGLGTHGAVSDSSTAGGLPPVPDVDAFMDYIAAIDAAEPISAAGLAELHTRAALSGKRFRVYGFNSELNEWEEAGRLSGGRYAHLRVAVQLVSRKGVTDTAALEKICEAVRDCAIRFSAHARCPDLDEAAARAAEVDALCAEVDIAIGVNVVAPAERSFAGTRIRMLAEGAGFKLEPDGLFHFRDDERRTLFTLDNHEPAPFLPEQIKHLTTTGVTLLLDVPRVADGYGALDVMLRTGAQLAQGLGGTLVDDNRVPLSDSAVHAIQQQLKSIHAKMEARGFAPGSERALRLFS
jgi:hypothetical protein